MVVQLVGCGFVGWMDVGGGFQAGSSLINDDGILQGYCNRSRRAFLVV